MNDGSEFLIDKQRVRRAFDRAAPDYDRAAVLQREVGNRLLERLDFIRLQPATVVDLGAGTGHLSKALTQRYKKARVISLDLAPNMLRQARQHAASLARLLRRQNFVCGDAERLPLASQSAEMLFSNLTLQWCSDLDKVFAEFRRLVTPGGLILFSTFGPDTLKELRDSWNAADQSISSHQLPLSHRERARGEGNINQHTTNDQAPTSREAVHVGAFLDMHDIGDALLRSGFSDPVMDAERFTLTYPDVYGVMRELKALGAHNAATGRSRTLTGKRRLQAMVEAYERYREGGQLPATFEVVYGLAWAPTNIVDDHEPGTVSVPISAVQRRPSGEKS